MRNVLTIAAVAASALLTTPALGGTFFRLEIGPPVADTSAPGKVKNAVLLVRPLACDDPAAVVITGTAEGFVNGSRRSVPLKLTRLATPGVHAVTRQWPDGRWVVNLTGACPGRAATAAAIVPIAGNTGFVRAKARFFDRATTIADVDASLQAAIAE
jgi:hypothetical protein